MKPIVLKYFNCDAVTEYAVLGNVFSFDYAVHCGITFITFFDEEDNTLLWVQASHDKIPVVDFEIVNDDVYCTEMERIIVDTVQEYIDDYLTNKEAVLDLNIVMSEVSDNLTTHYREFFDKKYKKAEV